VGQENICQNIDHCAQISSHCIFHVTKNLHEYQYICDKHVEIINGTNVLIIKGQQDATMKKVSTLERNVVDVKGKLTQHIHNIF